MSTEDSKEITPQYLIVQPEDNEWDPLVETGDEVTLVKFNPKYHSNHPFRYRISKPESPINIRGENHFFRILDLPIESKSLKFDFLTEDTQKPLTPELLSSDVIPVLSALCEIEKIISKGHLAEPRIVAITQQSPVNVSMTGIPEAYKALREDIMPWRKKHQKEMARLNEQEKQAEIERKRAEVAEATARTDKERAEAGKIRAESQRIEAETRQQQFELQKKQVEFAFSLVEKLAPKAAQAERLVLFKDLLPHIETLALTDASISLPSE